MTETIKTIRIIPFIGKDEDWNRWSKAFMTMVSAKGYREVIKPTKHKKVADTELNIQVYNNMILNCQEEITFGIIDEFVSETFPDGDARLAWKRTDLSPTQGQQKCNSNKSFTS